VGADNPLQLEQQHFHICIFRCHKHGNANYKNLTKNTCYGFNNDLRPANTGRQYVGTYIINTMGKPATANYSPDNLPATTETGDIMKQAAVRGGGVYYEVQNAADLKAQLIQAFQDIIKRAAAGTAASVLASGEGSGANLIQAVFYPRRKFGDDEIAWIGRLSNFWFYVDPFFGNSTIRQDDGDKILNLKTDSHTDYIAELYYDSATETTRARRYYDNNGDGVKESEVAGPRIEFEKLGNLWEAGVELWKRSSARTIYANCNIDSDSDNANDTGACLSTTGLMNFSTANRSALRRYLQATDDNEAEAIIRYIHGEDNPVIGATTYLYRPRTVRVDLNSDGDTTDTVDLIEEGTPKVWKLGDVLNSTPKVSSWIPLNEFHRTYLDSTYGNSAGTGGYIYSAGYKNRGMVFAGANDGMLHAFNLGKLQQEWSGQNETFEKARLSAPATGTFGEEMWAFIPKSVLPYLTYQKDSNYCHIYSVDLTPYVLDASINKPAGCSESDYWNCTKTEESWRTILIGGMRYGGACRKTGSTCTDCVKTPLDDPADAAKGLGYSSYFALDITDQNNPKLLWEWDGMVQNENHLGFSTSGPDRRINARTINGR
jgi:type IV pilus assembly protein PilY1